MRKNNLYDVEKNLRSIAKRYENVKYSVGLAVLFLMKGANAFSDNNIIQDIDTIEDFEKYGKILSTLKQQGETLWPIRSLPKTTCYVRW